MACVTELLESIHQGHDGAQNALFAHLYAEIKVVARARLSRTQGRLELNTTALVHEGFLRIADRESIRGRSRGEFFAYVGRVLRSIVVDYIRAESADKRSAGVLMLTLSAAQDVPALASDAVDVIALDRALTAMQAIDAGLYELVESLHFAGLTVAELAELRGVSRRTVERDVVKARSLLLVLMNDHCAIPS